MCVTPLDANHTIRPVQAQFHLATMRMGMGPRALARAAAARRQRGRASGARLHRAFFRGCTIIHGSC